jgi:Escherichia/Staphylococcus phage prohead protease
MTKHYAYSQLILKAVDNDARILEGIATTPTPDSMDDVVDPEGAEFSLPVPLFWQHDSGEPVGRVTHAKVTAAGIPVRAQFADDDEPGRLQEELHRRWRMVRTGLVGGFSIGFRPLEWSRLDNGGIHWRKWKWIELSVVTLPANIEATITNIKSAAQRGRSMSDRTKPGTTRVPHVKTRPARLYRPLDDFSMNAMIARGCSADHIARTLGTDRAQVHGWVREAIASTPPLGPTRWLLVTWQQLNP